MGAALQEATVRLLFVQVCCSMTSDYEICWTFVGFAFSTIWCVQKSPHLRVKENSVISVSGRFCGLAPLRPLKLKREGHSQRLFIEATLMCGLTADISNVKLWATSELSREPPVSSAWLFLLSQWWRCGERELVLAGSRPELSCRCICSSYTMASLFDMHTVTLWGMTVCMITLLQVPIRQ